MTSRPRCDRGHFLPAGTAPGQPCPHPGATYDRVPADLWGQGVPRRRLHRMATVQVAGGWL
ncbi:hypothetical protein [Streptomyces sp. YIM S03343]